VKVQNWHLNNCQKYSYLSLIFRLIFIFTRKNTRNFLKRVDQDLKKRKIQTFKNEIKKKNRCIEEIKNIEEINNCKGKIKKIKKNNLIFCDLF